MDISTTNDTTSSLSSFSKQSLRSTRWGGSLWSIGSRAMIGTKFHTKQLRKTCWSSRNKAILEHLTHKNRPPTVSHTAWLRWVVVGYLVVSGVHGALLCICKLERQAILQQPVMFTCTILNVKALHGSSQYFSSAFGAVVGVVFRLLQLALFDCIESVINHS